jgi:protein transport protein SEC61 subunit gamma-like protein
MGQLLLKIDSNFQQYKRVWRLLKRPTMEEFKTISKVSAIGILIMGVFGFAIALVMKLVFGPILS